MHRFLNRSMIQMTMMLSFRHTPRHRFRLCLEVMFRLLMILKPVFQRRMTFATP